MAGAGEPDVVCLQELKCADESLPIADIEAAGYGAVWHGQKGFNGVAILARGAAPALRRVGLPGDPDDSHSRYIEAEVGGVVVASLYLPNGNPIGTEKFDYKLQLAGAARSACPELLAEERPAVLAGDFNVVPEDRDVFSVRAMANDALMQPESRAALRRIVHQGWTDALARAAPGRRAALHLLGLYRRLLAARRGFPHRPSALLARSRRPAARRRRRQMGEGRGESLRPRPDLGGAGIGAYPEYPLWMEICL